MSNCGRDQGFPIALDLRALDLRALDLQRPSSQMIINRQDSCLLIVSLIKFSVEGLREGGF